MLAAAGPLGRLIQARNGQIGGWLDANALIMMRRVALLDGDSPVRPEDARALHRWATDAQLGMKANKNLLLAVRTRRETAVKASGRQWSRKMVRPEWRVIVGSGERANPHEIGITLHGTYGWPILPGSSLKGLAAAWARDAGVDAARYQYIFGHSMDRTSSRQDQPKGAVTFLDALPAEPLTVTLDLVNPHFRNEWTNPVPSQFLTVSSGFFELYLTSDREEDCSQALIWCCRGLDDFGIGAKTGVGYGYLVGDNT